LRFHIPQTGLKISDHLEFALKYDGIHMGLLARIVEHAPQEELTEYIKSKPTFHALTGYAWLGSHTHSFQFKF
jgi:hypothetical protein